MKSLVKWKKPIVILIDAVLINLAYILALYFRYNYGEFKFYSNNYKEIGLIVTVIFIACFYLLKLYKIRWSYASMDEFLLAICGCLVASVNVIILFKIFPHGFDYGVNIIACVFSIIFIVGFRMFFRIYGKFDSIVNCNASKSEKKRVLIIGFGEAAAMIINKMKSSNQSKYMPIDLIDNEEYIKGDNIMVIKVRRSRHALPAIAKEKTIEAILMAILTIDYEDKKNILEMCKRANCKIEIIPGIFEMIKGKISLSQIRKIDIDYLLGHKAIVASLPTKLGFTNKHNFGKIVKMNI